MPLVLMRLMRQSRGIYTVAAIASIAVLFATTATLRGAGHVGIGSSPSASGGSAVLGMTSAPGEKNAPSLASGRQSPGALAAARPPASAFTPESNGDHAHGSEAASWERDCDRLSDAGFPACIVCGHDYECSAGQGCALNRESGHQECVPSNCAREEDCPAGWSCRAVGHDQKIRRCVEHGVRASGEHCNFDPTRRDSSCEEGLICFRHKCAEPCPTGACPDGKSCTPSPDGPVCHKEPPTCLEAGCPSGQSCELVRPGVRACVSKMLGDNCIAHACTSGKRCESVVEATIAEFFCATTCNPLAPSCPRGQVCGQSQTDEHASVCYRDCTEEGPDACPKGQSCSTVTEDGKVWGCVPHPGPKPKPGSVSN